MNKKKKQFARRFSMETWMTLCQDFEFEKAFSEGNFELAESLAWKILNQA